MEHVIELTEIHKRFDSTAALAGVTLRIDPGEMFAVVGPDGAGKTTLLRAITGLISPDDGEIRLFGMGLREKRRAIRERIGYLSQGFSLYRDLTIDENIAFFARIHGICDHRSRAEELLSFTRLVPFRTRLAGRLSGGMKKKLALACALIHAPDLLLLDEPTTGVDPVSRRDFWMILGDLRAKGLTIVVATPYLDEAERCSRVGLIQEGNFLTIGTPEKIRGSVTGTIFEAICEDPRDAQRRLQMSPFGNDQSAPEIQTYGDRIHVKYPTATSQVEMDALLRDAGVIASAVRAVEPSLEDVYVSLVERAR